MIKNHLGYLYHDREISWLSFNHRVLQEAADRRVPLLERLKFLSIFSSNLDEFFRVRVASLRRMIKVKKRDLSPLQNDPMQVLEEIQKKVLQLQKEFDSIYKEIIAELERENIFIINEKQLDESHKEFVKQKFIDEVQPHLFPVMFVDKFEMPQLSDKSIYQVISMSKEDGKAKAQYAIMEVPVDACGRFIVLPKKEGKTFVILLDDVIRSNMHRVFSIFDFDEFHAYTVKLTRDAELDMDYDLSENLMEKLSKSLLNRKKGDPTRLVYDERIPNEMLEMLIRRLKVSRRGLIPGGRYHNFKDFINFPKVGHAKLSYPEFVPAPIVSLDKEKRMFDAISKHDYILHHPYQSFNYLIRLLREAAIDPAVQTIHITLYRVAKYSNVANALINAVKNGVKVTVFMELHARFDEESNIYWTNKLQEGGATVYFGKPGQKIHSKICLITRKENGKMARYAHLSTGNYNRITARLYCDSGLLTKDKRLTSEIEEIFMRMPTPEYLKETKHLLLAPVNMKKKYLELVQKEIVIAKKGGRGRIIAKMNSLVDDEMINSLYEASKAGVKIDLIIRGICCLVPGVPGLSENIRTISIIDRLLEHSRVYIFGNGGKEIIYMSSADWMTRNLEHRIELAFPLYDEECRKQIRTIIDLQLMDCNKARRINETQNNPYVLRKTLPVQSQADILTYLKGLG